MKKHSQSLLLSLLIHAVILGAVFYASVTVTTLLLEPKEKRICIQLGVIRQSVVKPTPKRKEVVKKEVKKIKEVKEVKKAKKIKEIKKKIKKTKKIKKIKKKIENIKKIKPQKPKKAPQKQEKKTTPAKIFTKTQCNKEIFQKTEPKVFSKEMNKRETTPPKASAKSLYVNLHLKEIAKLLEENLYYPRRARKRGIEGEVRVKFTLKKDAAVENIEILSSNNEILSRGARKTVENLSGLFPKPTEDLTLIVPIHYFLSH